VREIAAACDRAAAAAIRGFAADEATGATRGGGVGSRAAAAGASAFRRPAGHEAREGTRAEAGSHPFETPEGAAESVHRASLHEADASASTRRRTRACNPQPLRRHRAWLRARRGWEARSGSRRGRGRPPRSTAATRSACRGWDRAAGASSQAAGASLSHERGRGRDARRGPGYNRAMIAAEELLAETCWRSMRLPSRSAVVLLASGTKVRSRPRPVCRVKAQLRTASDW